MKRAKLIGPSLAITCRIYSPAWPMACLSPYRILRSFIKPHPLKLTLPLPREGGRGDGLLNNLYSTSGNDADPVALYEERQKGGGRHGKGRAPRRGQDSGSPGPFRGPPGLPCPGGVPRLRPGGGHL